MNLNSAGKKHSFKEPYLRYCNNGKRHLALDLKLSEDDYLMTKMQKV